MAAAFVFSAATKLSHPAGFRDALAAFGVPSGWAVVRFLPVLEAGLAVALVGVPGAAWPAILAIGVLAVFTGAVVVNLAGGRTVPCPCFSPAGDRPVSAATVARNGFLAGLAVVGTGSTAGASPALTALAGTVAASATLAVVRRIG